MKVICVVRYKYIVLKCQSELISILTIMRMPYVLLAFLFLTYEVHSFVQYPNGSEINSVKSDNYSILTIPLSIVKSKENLKVFNDNRPIVKRRLSRDLNLTNETLSQTDIFTSFNSTTDNSQGSDQSLNDTLFLNKNSTSVTSINSSNNTIDNSDKFFNNTPTTHGTNIIPKIKEENATNYTDKLANVTDMRTNSNQLVNDTNGNDKFLENTNDTKKSINMTWKKRHVDQETSGVSGQSMNETNQMIHMENIKNIFYIKSINVTNDDGSFENLICTKMSILPDNIRRQIIRKMDRYIKKAVARINIKHSGNNDDNEEEENNDDEYEDDDNNNNNNNDDDEDEEDDDDDDDDCGCGCGCGCKRRMCCGCRKYKRKKCPSCTKIVTPPPESGRRSGATFPINFESSEIIVDTTTPIETTELSSTTLSTTITPTTTTTTTEPSTTTTTTTPSTTTTTTTPSTTTTTTTPSTTTISSTTQYFTTSTSTEISTTKKRNSKRKKCTKKKRRKEELVSSDAFNRNSTIDNDREMNYTKHTRVPFSESMEPQVE